MLKPIAAQLVAGPSQIGNRRRGLPALAFLLDERSTRGDDEVAIVTCVATKLFSKQRGGIHFRVQIDLAIIELQDARRGIALLYGELEPHLAVVLGRQAAALDTLDRDQGASLRFFAVT